MNKTKAQLIVEKLRKVGHKVRMGAGGMPPLPFQGKMPRGPMSGPMPGPHGPMGLHTPNGAVAVPMPFCPPQGGMPDHRGPHGAVPAPMPFRGPHGGMPHHGPLPREALLLTILEQDEEGNGIRQKEIADAVGIHAPALSEQIDRLEADRYLERRANPEDKRSTLIVLTEKGKARANEVLDERRQAAEVFCAGLTEEEQDTLLQLLDKLLSVQNREDAAVKA